MTRDELIANLVDEVPWFAPGDVLYVELRDGAYSWRSADDQVGPVDAGLPEAWIFHSGPWPTTDKAQAYAEDLLAEMESMLGGADRCRWPLDDPWPHLH